MKIKRRKFLIGVLGAGGLVSTFGGYKWYQLNRQPTLLYLNSKKQLIGSLAECIIPKSKEANIDDVVTFLIQNCADIKSQNRFIDGILDLEERTRSQFNCDFINCNDSQKRIILSYYSDKSRISSDLMRKVVTKLFGRPFFITLKEYTARAFFSSEFGASQVLNYSHIPGRYIGCIPLEPNQPSWATE